MTEGNVMTRGKSESGRGERGGEKEWDTGRERDGMIGRERERGRGISRGTEGGTEMGGHLVACRGISPPPRVHFRILCGAPTTATAAAIRGCHCCYCCYYHQHQSQQYRYDY